MNGTLNEQVLKKNPSTESLPVMDEDDWNADYYLGQERVCEFAEARDSVRLFELLHRDEYQPVVAVRNLAPGSESIRVFFRQLHATEFFDQNNHETHLADRSSLPRPH